MPEFSKKIEDKKILFNIKNLLLKENKCCIMQENDGSVLIEDSVEVFERTDGLYYVSVLTETDMSVFMNVYIMEKAEDALYGFRIVAKTGM